MESVLALPSTPPDTILQLSGHWLDVLEAASVETQSADHRLACARSVAFSRALPFLLRRAIRGTSNDNNDNNDNNDDASGVVDMMLS